MLKLVEIETIPWCVSPSSFDFVNAYPQPWRYGTSERVSGSLGLDTYIRAVGVIEPARSSWPLRVWPMSSVVFCKDLKDRALAVVGRSPLWSLSTMTVLESRLAGSRAFDRVESNTSWW